MNSFGGGSTFSVLRAFVAVAALLFAITANAQTGEPNNVQATTVPLYAPAGLAYDSAGNLFIASRNDNIIRKVDLQGIITTVAGTGEQGFGGDGGAATSALLDSPQGVAVDAAGNIFIADTHNHRIREVLASTGVIQTIAGTGVADFSGDSGLATTATLNLPQGVAVDSVGNVYIADTNNQRIRKVSGGTITTVAGNGDQAYEGDGVLATATGLDSPSGLAVDTALNLYIGDTHNQRVRLVTAATGIITTFAGTGTFGFSGDSGAAAAANLARPRGVAIDAAGNVYIADSDNNRVRTISANGTITTLAGNGEQGFFGDTGAATSAVLDTPRATATFGAGGTETVAFSDSNDQRARAVTNGTIQTVAGLGATGESLTLAGQDTVVYGSGTLTATFASLVGAGSGQITLLEGSTTVATGTLSSNTATLTLPALSAGMHKLVATYPGDSANPAVSTGIFILAVTPAPLVATANSASVIYGVAIPTLTGTLSGVLPADASNVMAVFATTATLGSPVSVYPITVSLTGSAAANYTVTTSSASGSLTITAAGTKVVLTSSNNPAYLGTAVPLTATVTSLTTGTPGGTVTFYDNTTTQIGQGTLNASGVATLSISTLALGSHSLTAVYTAAGNFSGNTSPVLTETITADPDFIVTPTTTYNTVVPGSSVSYTLTVTPLPAPFTAPITFVATGLPSGATATFSPSSVTPNGTPTNFVMTVKTAPLATLLRKGSQFGGSLALTLLTLPLFSRKRRRTLTRLTATFLLCLGTISAATLISGCGTTNGFFGQAPANYTITVTATSTSVLNTPITHSTTVTLNLQ